jgi:hypothetical protein
MGKLLLETGSIIHYIYFVNKSTGMGHSQGLSPPALMGSSAEEEEIKANGCCLPASWGNCQLAVAGVRNQSAAHFSFLKSQYSTIL